MFDYQDSVLDNLKFYTYYQEIRLILFNKYGFLLAEKIKGPEMAVFQTFQACEIMWHFRQKVSEINKTLFCVLKFNYPFQTRLRQSFIHLQCTTALKILNWHRNKTKEVMLHSEFVITPFY